MASGYKFEITPVDAGSTIDSGTLTKGATKSESACHDIVVACSSAQIQGVFGHLALIKAGSDTSSIESAVTALTP